MVNRYMAGDWRQYHFEIDDKKINAASIDISWENDNTNLSVFMIDPKGKIIQSNVPSGAFGHFINWPSSDWLGTTAFSQGGGFFPVKNKDKTSTVMYAPINQTGTYTLMVHSTLFDGKSTTEPISIAAKFTSILLDDDEPQIIFSVPEFIKNDFFISPKIIDENLDFVKYFIDGKEIDIVESNLLNPELFSDGFHELKITARDIVGNEVTKTFSFNIDNLPPKLIINSPNNDTTVSDILYIDFQVIETNLPKSGGITITLPNGELITDETSVQFDTSQLDDGQYELVIAAQDQSEKKVTKTISFNVIHEIDSEKTLGRGLNTYYFVIIGVAIGIMIGIGFTLLVKKKMRISKKP